MNKNETKLAHFFWDDSIEQSKLYVDKYELRDTELLKWIKTKNKVFNNNFIWRPNERNNEFKDYIFNDGFIIRPILGGGLFSKVDFIALNNCMKIIGDEEFVIIQDIKMIGESDLDISKKKAPLLSFKYPIGLNWNDYMINEGNSEGITYELNSPIRNYFVFGDKGKWGKYTANDANEGMGVDIIGFKPEYLDVFREHFPISTQERKNLEQQLPKHYIKHLIW